MSQLKTRAAKIRRSSAEATDLATILEESLETCESLLRELAGAQLQCETLTRRCESETALRVSFFQQMPIACIEASDCGRILRANRPAALLLNVSSKHLENRLLLHFTEHRAEFATVLKATLEKNEQRAMFVIRPRERAPLRVEATILRGAPDEGTTWFLVPIESFRTPAVAAAVAAASSPS